MLRGLKLRLQDLPVLVAVIFLTQVVFTVTRFKWEKYGLSLGHMDRDFTESFQILLRQGCSDVTAIRKGAAWQTACRLPVIQEHIVRIKKRFIVHVNLRAAVCIFVCHLVCT